MTFFEVAAGVLTLSAIFGYVNVRWLRLPTTIGLMALALASSLLLVLVDSLGVVGLEERTAAWLGQANFSDALLHGMLGLLLFAGALHIDLDDLARERLPILVLALPGTLLSTFLVAGLSYVVFDALGAALSFGYCLVLGALISPTDPIAVLGILKTAGVPKSMETQISGESMFNDGIGVVVFTVVVGLVAPGGEITVGKVATLFVREAVGGAALGLALGYVAFRMLRDVEQYQVEVLITLALVVGGYSLAEKLHVSAPIGAVVAGLLIGNHGRRLAMGDQTREHLDTFWELVDEILNAVLFVLIGLEVIVLTFGGHELTAGVALVAITLGSRWISVGLPVELLRLRVTFAPHAVKVMTWGGLRGGISVALALSLPAGHSRDVILTATYVVVAFSILVQGLTLRPLLRRWQAGDDPDQVAPSP